MNEGFFLNYNGKICRSDKLLISANNRSFRYGDGFFETMKMVYKLTVLSDFHFERLFNSLKTMHFEKQKFFTKTNLKEQIIELAKKNDHQNLAKIRLTIFRGNGGLNDVENNFPNYIIQTWELNYAINLFNENGLMIDVYRDAKKSCDLFSSIKSNNYLPYAMAAFWAKQNKLNDALLLNNFNRIADATIANVFIVKDKIIKTPKLSEGCVAGIMRRYLLDCFAKNDIDFEETELSVDELFSAEEVFLTNSIFGIKWVKQAGEKLYKNDVSKMLHEKFIQILNR